MLVLLASSLYACKAPQELGSTEPLKERSSGFLVRKLEKSNFNFDWMGMKIDADMVNGEESQGFKATIRMRKDSAVWASVSPALGIEMIRVLVSEDSAKLISHIPGDKFIMLGDVKQLSESWGIELELEMLQNFLIGNPVGMSKEEGKLKSGIDGNYYTLVSKVSRKLKRVTGNEGKSLEELPDTLQVRPDLRPRAQRRLEDDFLMVKYWIDPVLMKIARCEFQNLKTHQRLNIVYTEFDEELENHYPHRCELSIEGSVPRKLSFKIMRINTQNHYDFPFEIDPEYPIKTHERKTN